MGPYKKRFFSGFLNEVSLSLPSPFTLGYRIRELEYSEDGLSVGGGASSFSHISNTRTQWLLSLRNP